MKYLDKLKGNIQSCFTEDTVAANVQITKLPSSAIKRRKKDDVEEGIVSAVKSRVTVAGRLERAKSKLNKIVTHKKNKADLAKTKTAIKQAKHEDIEEDVDSVKALVAKVKVGDKTNFGVVTKIDSDSITFKAKDLPVTKIIFRARKMGSKDFVLDKLLKIG